MTTTETHPFAPAALDPADPFAPAGSDAVDLGLDPFALGGSNHPDLALLAAEQEFHQLETRIAVLREAGADEETEIDSVFMRWMAVMDLIATTPPATIAGCAAKLRALMHEEVGIPSGESEHDMTCLRQVRDFLAAAADAA